MVVIYRKQLCVPRVIRHFCAILQPLCCCMTAVWFHIETDRLALANLHYPRRVVVKLQWLFHRRMWLWLWLWLWLCYWRWLVLQLLVPDLCLLISSFSVVPRLVFG